MALQFVLGNSGSGKTHYIQEKIIKEADSHPEKNYLIIVPEQFTMQTQRELVLRHENHSIMNIDILSFARLAYRIFDELGTPAQQVLEETGKNLVLRKVAQEKLQEFTVLKGNITKTGYIDEIKSLISELTQYNVTPEDLQEMVDRMPKNSFSCKLSDVSVMYQGFLDFIKGRFITTEEVLELLIEVAADSEILKGAILVFDGFTGFTPIQNNLLRELLPLSEMTYITVTIDSREDFYGCSGIHELFAMSKQMIASSMKMAEDSLVEVINPVVLEPEKGSRYTKGSALFFLEQNLFRSKKNWMDVSVEDEIQLYSLSNPRQELDFAARKIEGLVRKEGLTYREIAVVCGDLVTYGNYAKEIFAEYKIPVFIDQKTTILYHPFIEYIKATLEIFEQDFSYEGVFRYLRSGLSQISREETDLLENYVLAAGIRGYKKWSKRFSYIPKGCQENDLEKINQIRENWMLQMDSLYHELKKKPLTVREISQALYSFMNQGKVEEQLKIREIQAEEKGDLKKAKEYAQIFKIVMDLLDKMVELLGEDEISLEEYRKILDAGFEAAKVGILPPGYDRVMFGDIERTRLDDISVLLFVGVNDGSIPKSGGADGILSQSERELLAKAEIELAPTVRERTFMQRFYLYLNLTKPKKKLYITYARVNGEGKSLRRSYLISVLLKMYPKLTIQEIDKEALKEKILTPFTGLTLLAEGIQSLALQHRGIAEQEHIELEQKIWGALYHWYQQREEWEEPLRRTMEASQIHYKETPISSSVTKALYGNVLENSVTRLEKFASCAFSHFLEYGLRLREREISGFAAVDMGNIFHETLLRIAEKMQTEGYNWFEISKEECEGLLKEALQEVLLSNHNTALYENARSIYIKERMERILVRTLWALTKQIRQGEFSPDSFEVSFAFADDLKAVNFKLSNEEQMHLRGRIDRIDTYDGGKQMYVKIIDYKSGNASFQLLNIYHGLQLQLVVYMNAAIELMEKKHPKKEVIPAGIFYYQMKDPMIEEDGELSEEMLQQKIFQELKLNGLVNEEKEILEKLDNSLENASSVNSLVLPVGFNKDGSLKKSSKTTGTEGFQILSSYVNGMIKKLGEGMLAGEIGINPYGLGDKLGCDYCNHRSICQFDTKIPGFEYRTLEELEEEEIFEKMRGAAQNWDLNGQENNNRSSN